MRPDYFPDHLSPCSVEVKNGWGYTSPPLYVSMFLSKARRGLDEYLSKFCCSLTCRVIFRISIGARNFCSSLNCLKDGSKDSKKQLSSSTPISSIFSAAKSAVVIPRRKFQFTSFFEYFEGVHFLLLVYCLIPLHQLRVFKLLYVWRSSV